MLVIRFSDLTNLSSDFTNSQSDKMHASVLLLYTSQHIEL